MPEKKVKIMIQTEFFKDIELDYNSYLSKQKAVKQLEDIKKLIENSE